MQERIEIAEQHHRRADAASRARRAIERVRERHAVAQGAFGCALDHFAIGHWIAEGNSELDDVGASRGEFDQQ